MKKKMIYWFIGAALMNLTCVFGQDSLFISELADPLDDYNGRFIELYNAGSETIDFSTLSFYLSRQSNGGTTWGEVQLSGFIEADDTYIIGGSGFSTIYGFEPDLVTGILTGNGDDPYYLFLNGNHLEGAIHDIFGVPDTDGTGEAWEYTDSRAVRLQTINRPNPAWQQNEWLLETANCADCDPGLHVLNSSGDSLPEYPLPSVYMTNDTIPEGSLLYLAIQTEELVEEDQVISYQFSLNYDPACLEYLSYSIENTLSRDGSVAVNSNIPGSLKLSFMSIYPLTGSGDLIELHFRSLTTDTTTILMEQFFLNNIAQDSVLSAEIVITEIIPPVGRIVCNKTSFRFADTANIIATFSEPMHTDSSIYLQFTGAVEAWSLPMNRINDTMFFINYPVPKATGSVYLSFNGGADLNGNRLVQLPTEGNSFFIIEFLPGDVNDDGLVQAYDAALTLQHSVGIDPLPLLDPLPWEAWRDSTANVDGIENITAYDAALILQYSAGLISAFGSEIKKSSMCAGIYFEVEEDRLIVYSEGELFGLNLSCINSYGIFGEPVVTEKSYLSAFNSENELFRLGLATAIAPASHSPLFEIPIRNKITGTAIFTMNINGRYSEIEIDLTTENSITEREAFKFFPNPASDRLNIQTNTQTPLVSIVNMMGETVMRLELRETNTSVDISDLPAGNYILTAIYGSKALHYKLIKD